MLQLCYASTFINYDNNLIDDIRDILITARNFNKEHQITGVLYYAEGHFFQCLEGKSDIVESLFQKIIKDHRHTNIHRFTDHFIEKTHFQEWSMKYVQKNSEIKKYFLDLGLSQFQPSVLDNSQLQEVLNILYEANASLEPMLKKGYSQRGYMPYL